MARMIDRAIPYIIILIGLFLVTSLLMSCERIEPNKKRNSRQVVMLAGV
jgi:hypothetical protein